MRPDVFQHSLVVFLDTGSLAPGAIQLIQLAESTLGPDAETPNVATGGEPQEVQFVDVLQCDACSPKHTFNKNDNYRKA